MSDKLPETSGSEEVDLGQLFKLIGKIFERFFKFLKKLFNKLFLAFVWVVFFLKKHFLKILIAGVIGFGIAFVKEKIAGPVYVSSVAVVQNYDTGENLYDLVNYYNSLINMEDTLMIVKALGPSMPNNTSFVSFEIEPMVNENLRIKSYDNYISDLDSTLASNIDYETYLKNTMEYDYRQQKISIKTKESRNLLPIFEGIINKVSTSQFYRTRQKRDIDELTNREIALKQGLIESDSLKVTYKRVLEKPVDKTTGSQTSVTVEAADNMNKTKEFELYKNDIELRRELVSIERAKQDKEEIIEIISSEFTSGIADNSIKVFGKETSRKILYMIIFSLVTLLLLMGLEINKFLDKFKDKI